jgi:hypothetical protein
MKLNLDRRRFLKSSTAAALGSLSFGYEEKNLQAQNQNGIAAAPPLLETGALPLGKIGKLKISRLICGGNLISGFAHSRDLIYVSRWLKEYFTDAKVCDTLQRCESQGINTAILRLDSNTLRILKTYRQDRQGKIQWIAQVQLSEQDVDSEIKEAIDHGAAAVYVHGGVGDYFAKKNKPEVLGKAIEVIKQNGVVAGIAGHMIEVPIMCQKAGLKPDFYLKTFNAKNYWSAGPKEQHDNVWEERPEETKAFMAQVPVPWIAYKVLGAGAIPPLDGFKYAFQHGADFVCVGMFDFQVAEDAEVARKVLAQLPERTRPWCA